MYRSFRTLLTYIGALGIVAGALVVFFHTPSPLPANQPIAHIVQTEPAIEASVASVPAALPEPQNDSEIEAPQSVEPAQSPPPSSPPQANPAPPEPEAEAEEPAEQPDDSNVLVTRILDPYPFPPESFLTINDRTRSALVNILCITSSGSLRPTSGSGIIIDPRGIILTNAHVAQYVLLAQSGRVNLKCEARSGAPARPLWNVEVLYIPPVWIEKHAKDIAASKPTGTGEHDYALLRITGPLKPSAAASSFTALPIDTRDGIGFVDDPILAASYPAEFIGGITAQSNLHPASSIASIQELLTFAGDTVDVISLGGIIGAQSGSSGGPVVNAWGHVIGIISTTSDGDTTAERDLHALTASYIDRDLHAQSGLNFADILQGDPYALAREFNESTAPTLVALLLAQIPQR